jgi:hypothetical protein
MIKRRLTAIFVLAIVAATTSSGVAQTDNGPLNKDGVLKTITFMKQTGSSDHETAQIISRTGVDFQMTKGDENELRQAGASDAVINAVRGGYHGQLTTDDTPNQDNPTKEDNPPKENSPPKENKNQRANNNRQPKQPRRTAEDNQTQTTMDEREPPTEITPPDQTLERPVRPTADQKNLVFKEGDRVEVDPTQYMPPNKKWYQATVVKVHKTALGDILDYDVKMDTVDGSEVISEHIPRRPNWIRPAGGAANAQTNQDAMPQRAETRTNEPRTNTRTANDRNKENLIFQVGDRVEVNVTQMMPPNTQWYQATVVKVNTNALGDVVDYDVKLDTVDGSEVIRDHIPKRPNWIRPSQ